MDSPKTTPTTVQAAQEEHRAATRVKSSTAHEPKSAQVSWCKSSIAINGKTHLLPTTKEYIYYMNMPKVLELYQVDHTT